MARNLKNSEDINVNATDEEISLKFARKMDDTATVDKKISNTKDELNKTDQEIQKSVSDLTTKQKELEKQVKDIADFDFNNVVIYDTCTEEELQAAIDASD